MKNDQWFEPGEKVARVCMGWDLGLTSLQFGPIHEDVDFGMVLCVKECIAQKTTTGIQTNGVSFVGINYPYYFRAACFRRVEEIKLCIAAVKKAKEPVKQL